MHRFLGISVLTALALAATERPAQAWVNSRFSVGLNWSFQSGGNSAFWGLWRNGQVPGPWGDGIIYGVCQTGNPGAGHVGGYDGHAYGYGQPHAGGGPAAPGASTPAAAPAQTTANPTQQAWQYGIIPNWYQGQNVFQAAAYQPQAPPANYGYPANAGYGYDYYGHNFTPPSYWYGR
jgi:hypothetical protein